MVAAKTGTTQEKRDAWTIGFTPSLVAGVWVGNNDNTPMKQHTAGVLIAAPLWKKFMQGALGTTTPETFTPPSTREVSKPILKGLWQGGSAVSIDRISRRIATDLTPKDFIEEIAVGEPHSILFWVQKIDPTGAPPSNPTNDPQFTHWEEAVQKWLLETNYTRPFSLILPGTDNIHTEENKPVILLQETDIVPTQKEILLSITSAFPIQEVLVRFDNLSLPVKQRGTHAYSVLLPETFDTGFHSIAIFAQDTYGNKQTLEKEIAINNNTD
jgi:penicillin-binding protein 1A